jgi:hypothetical protein
MGENFKILILQKIGHILCNDNKIVKGLMNAFFN